MRGVTLTNGLWRRMPGSWTRMVEARQLEALLKDPASFVMGFPRDGGGVTCSAALGVKYLDIDTGLFGLKMGLLLAGFPLGRKAAADLREPVRKTVLGAVRRGFHHLTAKCPAGDTAYAHALEDAGFRIVIDNVVLKRRIPADERFAIPETVRPAREADHSRIAGIAARCFSEGTRFHLDRTLPADKATELHALWARNLCHSPDTSVFCAWSGSALAGIITCGRRQDLPFSPDPAGYIDLVCVDPGHQGQGLGKALVNKALEHCHDLGLDRVFVDTEGINLSALGLYHGSGFEISDSRFIFHRWRHPRKDISHAPEGR